MSLTIEEVNIIIGCDIDECLKNKIYNIYLSSEKRKQYNREYYQCHKEEISERRKELRRKEQEELITLRQMVLELKKNE